MTPIDRTREQANAMGASFGSLLEEVVLRNANADSPLLHAEGLRYLTRVFAQALIRSEIEDYAYPRLIPGASLWMHWGFANPDARYIYASIHGDYTYRLYGRRGSARMFDIETWSGGWADLTTMHHCSGLRHIQVDSSAPLQPTEAFEVGPDGEFEIILSSDPQPGNWLKIPKGLGTVLTRDYFYDWDHEEAGTFYLERVGATYPPPPVSIDLLNDSLDLVPEFMDKNVRICAKGIEVQHYSLEPNTMCIQPMHTSQTERGQDDQLALRDVRFLQGLYDCGPDEAVILEVPEVDTDYWSFYLTSHNWEGNDFHLRQSSINGWQAEVDSDGMFRAVISQRDPGVPNWLDPGGHRTGLIIGRYLTPRAELTEPRLRILPFEALRDELPPGTKTVTPEERSESIRRRMHSVRRRLCDD